MKNSFLGISPNQKFNVTCYRKKIYKIISGKCLKNVPKNFVVNKDVCKVTQQNYSLLYTMSISYELFTFRFRSLRIDENFSNFSLFIFQVCNCSNKDLVDWIQCERCDQWFHCQCINISREDADELDSFFCPQ